MFDSSDFLPHVSSIGFPLSFVLSETSTSSALTRPDIADVEGRYGFNHIAKFRIDGVVGPDKPAAITATYLYLAPNPSRIFGPPGTRQKTTSDINDATSDAGRGGGGLLLDLARLPPGEISAGDYLLGGRKSQIRRLSELPHALEPKQEE